ncbi:MAG TPA: Stp1/IreP family PP2C-type Ser/Thr phosphatase [Nitrososphaeraceae archaeon]|nr:Stp1/IreP family PP2C-type Ser/Thr phosphatase [Nitrososphaeraceae archaeon]
MKTLLISGHKSDIGLVRQNNEDALYTNDRLGVYVLADGMGGHEGGEIASNIVVNTVAKFLSRSIIELQNKNVGQIVHNALHEANEEIILFRKNQFNLMSMATTVVISIFLNDVVNCIHLGDSRAYLYNKDNDLIQLTPDDSLVTEMVKQGMMRKDELKNHSLRNIVTRYLGTINLTLPEIQQFRVETNDCIMLCSDGLTNMLNDKEIQSILRENISIGPQDVCDLLVDKANAKGGQDNISVIVVQSK